MVGATRTRPSSMGEWLAMAQRNNNNAEMPPNSGIVSEKYERGFEATFGARKCKACKVLLEGEASDALWCQKCKAEA
jgi:hypothetical protein